MDIPLEELVEYSNGLFKGRYVHFSSCRTFIGSQENIDDFTRKTGAKLVTGYSHSVPADLSAMHDSLLIGQMIDKQQKASIISNMDTLCAGLSKRLGFRYSQF